MAFGQYLGLITGVIGAIIGGVLGGIGTYGFGAPAGAAWGFTIGSMIGGIAGQVFWPEKADINTPPPPQPHETRLQFSSWGMSIPIEYGSGRMAGNIIYMSDIVETITRSKHRQDEVRYYEMVKTYTATFAISFCEGPVPGVARIWMNNKVFADYRDPYGPLYPSGDIGLSAANVDTTIAREGVFFSLHLGSETQTADSTLSTLLTAAENPAYRGLFYITFIDFPIGEFSGVPNIEVEVSENAITDANVNTGVDDSEFRPGSGNLYKTNAVLLVGTDSSATTIFLRFNLIRVRPGATIASAIVTMKCAGVGTTGRSISGSIRACAEDSGVMPNNNTEAWGKVYTSASVSYSGKSEDRTYGEVYAFGDLKTVIQEIINRPGWVYGNSIVLAFLSSGVSSYGFWSFAAYENVLGFQKPSLDIEWAIN